VLVVGRQLGVLPRGVRYDHVTGASVAIEDDAAFHEKQLHVIGLVAELLRVSDADATADADAVAAAAAAANDAYYARTSAQFEALCAGTPSGRCLRGSCLVDQAVRTRHPLAALFAESPADVATCVELVTAPGRRGADELRRRTVAAVGGEHMLPTTHDAAVAALIQMRHVLLAVAIEALRVPLALGIVRDTAAAEHHYAPWQYDTETHYVPRASLPVVQRAPSGAIGRMTLDECIQCLVDIGRRSPARRASVVLIVQQHAHATSVHWSETPAALSAAGAGAGAGDNDEGEFIFIDTLPARHAGRTACVRAHSRAAIVAFMRAWYVPYRTADDDYDDDGGGGGGHSYASHYVDATVAELMFMTGDGIGGARHYDDDDDDDNDAEAQGEQ